MGVSKKAFSRVLAYWSVRREHLVSVCSPSAATIYFAPSAPYPCSRSLTRIVRIRKSKRLPGHFCAPFRSTTSELPGRQIFELGDNDHATYRRYITTQNSVEKQTLRFAYYCTARYCHVQLSRTVASCVVSLTQSSKTTAHR